MAGLLLIVVIDKRGSRFRGFCWVVGSLTLGLVAGCLAMRAYLMFSIGLPLIFDVFEPSGTIPTRDHPDL